MTGRERGTLRASVGGSGRVDGVMSQILNALGLGLRALASSERKEA
jgi:hypothetical protein